LRVSAPTSIAEAPIFSTSLASLLDASKFDTSESINTNNNAFSFLIQILGMIQLYFQP